MNCAPIRIMVRRVESMTKHNREAAAFIVHLALDLTCLSMVSQGKVWTKKKKQSLDWEIAFENRLVLR